MRKLPSPNNRGGTPNGSSNAINRSSCRCYGLGPCRRRCGAETFRKLKEKETRAKLAGLEITDDVHWTYRYMRGGTIKIFSMGAKPAQDIKVLLDGKPYIELSDNNISGPGAIGVWTKADSVTAFDDFSFEAR